MLHSADKENVTPRTFYEDVSFFSNTQTFVYPSCGFMIKVWGWFGAASSLSLSSFNHVAEIFHLFFLLAF